MSACMYDWVLFFNIIYTHTCIPTHTYTHAYIGTQTDIHTHTSTSCQQAEWSVRTAIITKNKPTREGCNLNVDWTILVAPKSCPSALARNAHTRTHIPKVNSQEHESIHKTVGQTTDHKIVCQITKSSFESQNENDCYNIVFWFCSIFCVCVHPDD